MAGLYHGGGRGLRVGDEIVPTTGGRHRDGCPICEARAAGNTVVVDGEAIDGPNGHADRVYVTTSRLYARYYASLAGLGDLYRVEPIGELVRSDEDPLVEAYTCPRARVVAVVDRAVRMTMAEHRRLLQLGGTTRRVAPIWSSVMRDLAATRQAGA